jgi:hypothetical protein
MLEKNTTGSPTASMVQNSRRNMATWSPWPPGST